MNAGKNFTPAEMPAAVRRQLTALCDEALAKSVVLFQKCHTMVGIGRFAEARITEVCKAHSLSLNKEYLLHPSPQNPNANKNWYPVARICFEKIGILSPRSNQPTDAQLKPNNMNHEESECKNQTLTNVKRQIFMS